MEQWNSAPFIWNATMGNVQCFIQLQPDEDVKLKEYHNHKGAGKSKFSHRP
jgi:hypothetical protein